MERLVEMFKDTDDENNWLRVPVITYLRECPKPEAAAYIEELAKLDPDAIARADFFSQSLDGFGEDDDSDDELIRDQSGEKSAPTTKDTAPVVDEKSKAESTKLQGRSGTQSFRPQATFAASQTSAPYTVRRIPTEPTGSEEIAQTAANPFDSTNVATLIPVAAANPSAEVASGGTVAPSIASQPPAPVAAIQVTRKLTLSIIFIPMAVSVVLLIVLWSVVSGWFERLIF